MLQSCFFVNEKLPISLLLIPYKFLLFNLLSILLQASFVRDSSICPYLSVSIYICPYLSSFPSSHPLISLYLFLSLSLSLFLFSRIFPNHGKSLLSPRLILRWLSSSLTRCIRQQCAFPESIPFVPRIYIYIYVHTLSHTQVENYRSIFIHARRSTFILFGFSLSFFPFFFFIFPFFSFCFTRGQTRVRFSNNIAFFWRANETESPPPPATLRH